MKFVKFIRGRRDFVGAIVTFMGAKKGYVEVAYHNGMKPTIESMKRKELTKITTTEFKKVIRQTGDTAMLQYL